MDKPDGYCGSASEYSKAGMQGQVIIYYQVVNATEVKLRDYNCKDKPSAKTLCCKHKSLTFFTEPSKDDGTRLVNKINVKDTCIDLKEKKL
ncbi:hypothetical protein KEM48_011292 [Puccinia striiformis f. sp. tritici PST-130]|nr:hypothetical protein KEM48_011292 [Puccinia striiformis f. sp. tritici PST-130]